MDNVQRKSNIELMRILCILLVVGGHYYYHGGWNEGLSISNTIFLKIFGGGSKLAVNCFVLITGYFGANIKTKRVLPLIRDRWFYSLFLTAVLVGGGICNLDTKLAFKTLFPLLSCRHNYITVFVMLYFFIPFINTTIAALGRKNFEKFLAVAILFISVIPSVYPSYANNTYAYIFWMIVLFCIGRYMGTYEPNLPWRIMLVGSILNLMILTFLVEPHIGMYSENYFIGMQYSFPLLVASVSLLGVFVQWELAYNRVINSLAKSTFAVYILHDDPNVRGYIWSSIFHNSDFGHSDYLWIHFVCTIFLVYVVCIMVDKVYKITAYKLLIRIPLNKVEKTIDEYCSVEG